MSKQYRYFVSYEIYNSKEPSHIDQLQSKAGAIVTVSDSRWSLDYMQNKVQEDLFLNSKEYSKETHALLITNISYIGEI